MYNTIKGALFGVAIGDALGAPLEFMEPKQIQHKYGTVKDILGGGWLNIQPGEVTDDTQMTIAVAAAIAAHPENPESYVGENFINWYYTKPKDIGTTCRSTIETVIKRLHGIDMETMSKDQILKIWTETAAKVATYNSQKYAASGALMRTVYPGLYYTDKEKAITIADHIARMTHFLHLSTHACVLYTKIIYELVKNATATLSQKQNIIADIIKNTAYGQQKSKTDLKTSGFVMDTLHCALYCIRNTTTFEDALICAVNLGGDTDTIGAITGGIAGAIYGYQNIPDRWIAPLNTEIKTTLNELTNQAFDNHRKDE